MGTVLDFPTITDVLQDDVYYPIRGTGVGRDKKITAGNLFRSAMLAIKNSLFAGGIVTINGGDTAKVDISAGNALINGKPNKWIATTSSAVGPAASTYHRIDVVIVDDTGTISIKSGSESLKASADPIFPSIDSDELGLAALYVDDTASVDLTNHIYQLAPFSSDQPNYYIKQLTTLNRGKYNFNNLILDAAITIDCTDTSDYAYLQRQLIIIKCDGYFYSTGNGDINIASPHAITKNGNDGTDAVLKVKGVGGAAGLIIPSNTLVCFGSGLAGASGDGKGDDAADFYAGGASGGSGASIIKAGVDGVDAAGTGGGSTDGVGGTPSADVRPFLLIKAYNFDLSGDIILKGGDGGDGADATKSQGAGGGGGASGGGGGHLILIAIEDVIVNAGSTINCEGGDGGDGGDATSGSNYNVGGSGGSGGAGGLLLIRSKTYTNNGTVSAAGGAAGSGGAASGGGSGNTPGSPGNTGTAGILDQALYNDLSSSLLDSILPLNIFGIEVI